MRKKHEKVATECVNGDNDDDKVLSICTAPKPSRECHACGAYWGLSLCQMLKKGIHQHHHHHLSLNHDGRWGTTDDFKTSFLHFPFSTALLDLANSRPVHSLILSFHFFLCLPRLLPPFTVPCKMNLDRPGERETCPYHCSLRFFTMVRMSSCGPFACWILARTSSLVTWSLYEMCSILQ